MSGEFLGTFTISVNKGKWVTIPAAFKKKFSPQSKQMAVVTIGSKTNLAIYPLDNWQEKTRSLENSDSEEKKQALLMLRHFAAPEQKMESNGRIKLTDDLINLSKIEEKVIIKGEGKFISIWKPEVHDDYTQKLLERHYNKADSTDY